MPDKIPNQPEEPLYARLQPYAPQRGFHVRNLHDGSNRWEGGLQPPWKQVTRAQAERLSALTQDPNNLASPPLFQVAAASQRVQIDEHEDALRKAATGQLAVVGAALPPKMATPPDIRDRPIGRQAAIPSSGSNPAAS